MNWHILTSRVCTAISGSPCATADAADPDDIIAVLKVPFAEAMCMIQNGEINDSQTICALALASIHLSRLH